MSVVKVTVIVCFDVSTSPSDLTALKEKLILDACFYIFAVFFFTK